MTRSIFSTLALTAAAASTMTLSSAFVPGVASEAEARRYVVVKAHRHLVYRPHFAYRPHYVVPRVAFVGTTYIGACEYLKRRAHITGSPYVWNRYYACIGH